MCQAGIVALALPAWVAPGEQQVADCRALASAVPGPYGQGIAATLRWIVGAAPSPIVGTDTAATAEAAGEEFFVAGTVELGESPLSITVPADAAQAVRRTLAWLLCRTPDPPVELPRRPTPTARQLYEEAVAEQPWRFRLLEEQAAGRIAAQQEAARLARLAARADELAQ
jgi:hypothetical protein